MKITQLKAENVKRIKAVNICPDENSNMVVIGGQNAQGKSSVLDSIWMALGGAKALGADPIRHGENALEIEIVTDGDLVIYKKFDSKGKHTLEVMNKTGTPQKSPQSIANDLLSKFSIDPLAFSNYDGKKQVEVVRQLAGLDTTEIDARLADAEFERKRCGIEYKALEGQLANKYRLVPAHELPKIDTAELEAQLTNIMSMGVAKHAALNSAQAAKFELDRLLREIGDLKDRYNNLVAEYGSKTKTYETLVERYKATPDAPDATSLKAQISEASNNNVLAEQQLQRAEDQRLLENIKAEQQEFDNKVQDIRAERIKMIQEAKLPVPGLDLTDDGLLYRGVPFEQCSSAERLVISAGIGIALDPKLRVLLIRDGSLLDNNSLANLARWAQEKDVQIWMERVGEGDECSVIIEDGEIK